MSTTAFLLCVYAVGLHACIPVGVSPTYEECVASGEFYVTYLRADGRGGRFTCTPANAVNEAES